MRTQSDLSDLAQWAAEDRGCGAQGIADGLRRAEGGESDALGAMVRWRDQGRAAVLATVVESSEASFGAGAKIAVTDDGLVAGSLNDAALEQAVASATLEVLRSGSTVLRGWERTGQWEWGPSANGSAKLLLEPFLPHWEVVVVGSGRVPDAVCGICAAVGIPFRVYDQREDAPDVPGARETVRGPWAEIGRRLRLGVGSHCVVATPKHQGDADAVGRLLSNRAVPYVGLMHNEAKASKLVAGLREAGTPVDARLHCPIGLAIATQNPGEIAIGILAEILAVANSRDVRPMGLDWLSSEPAKVAS
jgi:xanthine dehydrogenase accessory factor